MALIMVERRLRLWAKRSWVGMVWPIATPLVLLALYLFVFKSVLRVQFHDYPAFLFSGLIPWTFLVNAVTNSVQSISSDADLVRRSRFAYELLPLACVAAAALFSLAVLAGFIVYQAATGHLVYSVVGELVPALVSLYLFVGGLSMLVALFDLYNRDLRWVLGSLLTVWFFLLPIVYPQDRLGHRLSFLRSVDPMSLIIGEFRYALVSGRVFEPIHVLDVFLISVAFFLACLVVFRRVSPQLPRVA
ncbi:MAG TPA: hypothetical protein VNF50_11065 [Acidimicrobiales bacterium]|nr:hypothetical protein [Acidimicrobiales bacterium]